jgi:mannosyl-oligosaccharide glucosidase
MLYAIIPFVQPVLAVASSRDPHSLLWGPYRPNLYFGLRPRVPQSLSIGLMWGQVENGALDKKKLRHTCEQSDGMAGYGWSAYDGRNGGTQTIADPANSVVITTEFIKTSNSPDRGNWAARVRGKPSAGAGQNWNLTAVLYFAMDGDRDTNTPSHLSCKTESVSAPDLVVQCEGSAPVLDRFKLDIPKHPKQPGLNQIKLHSLTVSNDDLWKAKGQ